MKWRYLPSKRKVQRERVKYLLAMDRECRGIAARGRAASRFLAATTARIEIRNPVAD